MIFSMNTEDNDKKRKIMKAMWSWSLLFGLLNIPVYIYSAISEHKFGFKLLCRTCHHTLKNVRWCEHCKNEVAWNNTVKGFEKSKGSFVVFTQEMINTLKPEKIDTIDIKEFVDQSEIEILYIKDHYYIKPAKEKDKAFYLFALALKKSKKVAIAQFIMHEKEHIIAISFYKNMLLLNTLHYDYEIRAVEFHEPSVSQTREELSLALLLINKFTHKKFMLSKYKDTFVEKLKKAIMAAHKIKKVTKKNAKKEVRKKIKTKESLAQSLKESLKGARA